MSRASRLETSTIAGPGRQARARPRSRRCPGARGPAARRPGCSSLGELERGLAVGRLAHDLVALGLQQHAGDRAEARVVVDDQDGGGHCRGDGGPSRASPTIRLAAPRCAGDLPKGLARIGRPEDRRARDEQRRAGLARTARPSSASMPPSTSRSGPSPSSARMRRPCPASDGMNACPPQPGLTVMHSAMSASTSASIAGGVLGQNASPARQPSSRMRCSVRSARAASPRRGS